MSEPSRPATPAPGATPPTGAAPAPAGPALPPVGPDQVALLIDDRPVVVRKGTTVLQAAETIDLLIPHYCYHPGLSIAGNCRMCLVEIEKMPKLQIGCATLATQGMQVRTTTPKVKTTRQGIMEFLLINHPLDCPICDQAGECRLQQYEADYGAGFSRFSEEKVHHEKRHDLGRHVMFDAERCIKCTRCIRFCDEVSRTHELTLVERGDHAIIATFPGRPLDNPYSGNTVDVCPVGALTLKEFRFKARVWFLRDVPSVCAGCARGCSVNLGTYRNEIHRMTPRLNPEVNSHWMCDAGRLSYRELNETPRLESPRIVAAGDGGPQREAAWDTALDRAAELLRAASSGPPAGGSLAALVSARLSLEDLHLARRALTEAIGIPRLALPPHEDGEDDRLLIRRDKTSNARGAALLGLSAPHAGRVREILDDVRAGRVRGLVIVGEDPVGDGLITVEDLRRLQALVVVDWRQSPTLQAAHVALPACGYGEYEGVLVNFEGWAQRARAALKPRGEAEPAWRILLALGRRFGLAGDYANPSEVFDEVAARSPAFTGLSYRALGLLGARVQGA
ncbi:MAG TPA: 2Fe-2S iron-sulfur cluster-binding protein [Candidatus Polarisedimenticolia bacterium]|nr:2Fe-2S iron-sulfur cluster-binding protein [Candidatus Polarisedimenticolia bacterium]